MTDPGYPCVIVQDGAIRIVGASLLTDGRYTLRKVGECVAPTDKNDARPSATNDDQTN